MEREKVFKQIEIADNFLKYAKPGTEDKARERARRRYEKALKMAMAGADDDTVQLIKLRLNDLARASARDAEPEVDDYSYEGSGGSIVVSDLPEHARDRVPPGQKVTKGWPVLHVGGIPPFDERTWSLEFRGEVEDPLTLSYQDLKDLGPVDMRSDFHCVTGWSKLDNYWTGIKMTTLLERVRPSDDASHVTIGDGIDYTANLPLEVLADDDVMLAWGHNGKDLAPKHGFPLRLVVPKYYAWKSVKWVRYFDFITADQRGFWELRGYHNRADPWLEERYSYQEA